MIPLILQEVASTVKFLLSLLTLILSDSVFAGFIYRIVFLRELVLGHLYWEFYLNRITDTC